MFRRKSNTFELCLYLDFSAFAPCFHVVTHALRHKYLSLNLKSSPWNAVLSRWNVNHVCTKITRTQRAEFPLL